MERENPNGNEEKKIDLFLGLLSINLFYILVVLENVYKKKSAILTDCTSHNFPSYKAL